MTWPKDSKQKHWLLNVECHWYEWKFLFFWGSVSFLMLKMQQVGVSLEYVTVTTCNNIKKIGKKFNKTVSGAKTCIKSCLSKNLNSPVLVLRPIKSNPCCVHILLCWNRTFFAETSPAPRTTSVYTSFPPKISPYIPLWTLYCTQFSTSNQMLTG